MALAIQDGKVIDKHLTLDEASIRKAMANGNKENQKKILERASKVKINRRIAS